MVRRKNNRIASKIDKLNERKTSTVPEYISDLRSNRRPKLIEIQPSDELIVSLSDAYENKRARQVVEWERVRRQNSIQRAV